MQQSLPRPVVLVVDDLFGRVVDQGTNPEREILCAQFLIRDVSPRAIRRTEVIEPVADAIFIRGQKPERASVGDIVENDLSSVLATVERGVAGRFETREDWSAILVDLCFYTGAVSADSAIQGVPKGRLDDDSPSGYFGLKLLAAMQERMPSVPVMVFSSKPRAPVAEQFSALGALAFLERTHPEGAGELSRLLSLHGLIEDPRGRLLGRSIALRAALRAARRAARGRQHVLLRGERGTGKELLASFVHSNSERADAPLVSVDVGAVPASLTSSELFGHRRGGFTGADTDRTGRFALASGGHLFLDEISNATSEMQIALLRVLETGEFSAVGESRTQTADVRVISATNDDIESVTAAGKFRADLLDRLRAGGLVLMPPLRDRIADLPQLARYFTDLATASTPGAIPRQISNDAMDFLKDYAWPGNVRELRRVMTESVVAYPTLEYLHAGHFSALLSATPGTLSAATGRGAIEATDHSPRQLARLLENWEPSSLQPSDLAGALPTMERAVAIVLEKLLSAAVDATKKRTPNSPDGLIQLSPAIRLLAGDPKMSSTRAADETKRLLAPLREETELLSGDAREALTTALRIRPSRKKA